VPAAIALAGADEIESLSASLGSTENQKDVRVLAVEDEPESALAEPGGHSIELPQVLLQKRDIGGVEAGEILSLTPSTAAEDLRQPTHGN
jgi:hypothetical protein